MFRNCSEELEVFGDDRLGALDRLGRKRRRRWRRESLVVAEHEFRTAKFEPIDRIEKATRPTTATEFAVGHNRQAKLLLHRDSVAYALILYAPQLFRRQLAVFAAAPGLHQFRRPLEAADVINCVGRDS